MSAPREPNNNHLAASTGEAIDVLLRFGVLMLRSGNTAARTRTLLGPVAIKIGIPATSVSISFDCIAVSVFHSGEWITALREIGPPGVNISRIAQLETLAKRLVANTSLREILDQLSEIESAPPLFSRAAIAISIGLASGGFAFLNGAAAPEMTAAAIGSGIGQGLRMWLSLRHVSHFAVAGSSAIVASGIYALAAGLAKLLGFDFAHFPAGFIASVLFLVPGVPLIAGLFDLLQYQTVAAVSRAANALMILLVVAFGLSIVIEVLGIDLSRQPSLELAYPLTLLLRSVASFVASAAFAMMFNSSSRTILAAGLLAVAANGLRLLLIDTGVMLAPATFVAALAIGVAGHLLKRHFDLPVMTTVVAPIIIMVPGLYAFEMIVLFNHGHMLEALQASASCGFVIGGLAMGLAMAQVFRPR